MAIPIHPTGVAVVVVLEQTALLGFLVVMGEQDYLPQSLVLQ
jgi:hypothetical protein